MDITRSSLLSTILYTVLLIVLFWSGEVALGSAPQESLSQATNVEWWTKSVELLLPQHYIGALLVFALSLMLARIAIKRVIYLDRTYMPSVLYVLICSAFKINVLSITPLLSAVFISMAVSLLIKSHRFKHIASKQIITSSTYFGISIILFPPSIYIAPLLFVGLAIFRHFSIKEWIIAVSGLIFPVAFYFLWVWITSSPIETIWQKFLYLISHSDGSIDGLFTGGRISNAQYIFLGVCLLLLLLCFIRFTRTKKSYKKHSRKAFSFFSFFIVWAIVIMLFSPVGQLSFLPIVAIPFSIIIPTYFASSRPTFFKNFIYLLLLLSAVLIHLV